MGRLLSSLMACGRKLLLVVLALVLCTSCLVAEEWRICEDGLEGVRKCSVPHKIISPGRYQVDIWEIPYYNADIHLFQCSKHSLLFHGNVVQSMCLMLWVFIGKPLWELAVTITVATFDWCWTDTANWDQLLQFDTRRWIGLWHF